MVYDIRQKRQLLISLVLLATSSTACGAPAELVEEGAERGAASGETEDAIGQSKAGLTVLGTYVHAWAWVDRNDGALPLAYASNQRVDALDVPPFRQYSTPGGTSVTHLGTGYWRVRFPNISVSGGITHVTAYGGNHHCKVSSWSAAGTNLDVYARCFDPTGAAIDGRFSVLFYRDHSFRSNIDGTAYAWLADAAAPASIPPAPYQFNSRDATNSVTRSAPGEYQVRLPQMQRAAFETDHAGSVQVTAYGSGPQRCKVRSWSQVVEDVLVNVSCFSGANSADSQFTLSFMRHPGGFAKFTAEDTQERFYVRGDATPVPSLRHQSDSYGSSGATMESLAPGTFRVHLPGVQAFGSSNAQVTALGAGSGYCALGGWFADSAISGTSVDVRCYTAAGSPSSSVFALLYSTDRVILF